MGAWLAGLMRREGRDRESRREAEAHSGVAAEEKIDKLFFQRKSPGVAVPAGSSPVSGTFFGALFNSREADQ